LQPLSAGVINTETVAATGNSTEDKIPRPYFWRFDDAYMHPRLRGVWDRWWTRFRRVQFPSYRRTICISQSRYSNNVTAERVRVYRRVYNMVYKIVLPVASRHRPRRGHSAPNGSETFKSVHSEDSGCTFVMWRRKSVHYAAERSRLYNCCVRRSTTMSDGVTVYYIITVSTTISIPASSDG